MTVASCRTEGAYPFGELVVVPAVGFGFLFRFVWIWVLLSQYLNLWLPMFRFLCYWWEVTPWYIHIAYLNFPYFFSVGNFVLALPYFKKNKIQASIHFCCYLSFVFDLSLWSLQFESVTQKWIDKTSDNSWGIPMIINETSRIRVHIIWGRKKAEMEDH